MAEAHTKHHDYHLVDPSPWPAVGSISAFVMAVGAITWMHHMFSAAPLVFGAGVLWHLLLHGRRYDVVHTASFPYFSLLAAGLLAPLDRFRLVVDWHEVWTREYWDEYLGRVGGWIGWTVQRLCARVPQRAYCFSRLHAARVVDEGLRGDVTILTGEYDGPTEPPPVVAAQPLVVFAGRQIPEKQTPALVPAIIRARERVPELRCVIYGDGPDRGEVERLVDAHDARGFIDVPGFVDAGVVTDALSRACAMVLPSRREGYGQVVVQASSRGTPSVVVAEPDNAAVELVEEGVNGFVAASASPEDLAAAIVTCWERRRQLRESTSAWFAQNAERLSIDGSLDVVTAAYAASG